MTVTGAEIGLEERGTPPARSPAFAGAGSSAGAQGERHRISGEGDQPVASTGEGAHPGELGDLHCTAPDSSLPFGMTGREASVG